MYRCSRRAAVSFVRRLWNHAIGDNRSELEKARERAFIDAVNSLKTLRTTPGGGMAIDPEEIRDQVIASREQMKQFVHNPPKCPKRSTPMSKLTQYSNVRVIFEIDGCQADAELSHGETMALAQFFKRAHWSEFRGCAIDDHEAYSIRAAVGKLQDALARSGYNPR